MTQDYSKKPPNGDPAKKHDAAHASHTSAGAGGRERTVPASELHDADIEKAKAAIAELVQKAREVELAREDPLADKPEIEFINELQDIFRQVHKLNARWLVDRGYEYSPPPVPAPQPNLTDTRPGDTPNTAASAPASAKTAA